MILLFTDFGYGDAYVGQMHRAICQVDPAIRVIDLFHGVPPFNIKAASYLLAAYCPPVQDGVYCCVVDPGVGGDRDVILVEIERCRYVGPDNGLFELLCRRYDAKVNQVYWRPEVLSNTFHGRDLFAPAAARLVTGDPLEARPGPALRVPEWPSDLDEIVYVDHYGNLLSGRRGDSITDSAIIECSGHAIAHARIFSDLAVGSLFWYRNANGLVEIAANQASARKLLGAEIGEPITVASY